MATPQRLPIVNSDDGTWGDILKQYLQKEHYDTGSDDPDNGGHKTITIRPGTSSAGTAPLKFSSGTLLSSAEAGAMEFNTDDLYFTITTGTTRKKVALYDDSSGATGDLYYRNSSGYFVRLGIGSAGQVLQTASGVPTWGTGNGGMTTATKTTSYTISSSDTVIFADATSANVTITLPAASGMPGYRFYIKRLDNAHPTYDVIVAPTGADTIDGSNSTFTVDMQYTAIAVVSNGSAWYIL